MKIDINLKLLAPLMHFGDERMGTMQIGRTLKFKVGDEFIDVPVYSGNAFRGELRRIAMKDYIEKLGISDQGITAKMYYMLFVGGALTSGSTFNDIAEKKEMNLMCPPISLLGTACGDQITEGKIKVGIFKPVCKELQDYTDIKSDISFYDMLCETFYTRKDDLKSKVVNITDESKNANATQMKYEMQGLAAGTVLTGRIVLENVSELEKSCLSAILNRFNDNPYIGGKSATGHGEVEATFNFDYDESIYYKYLNDNKDAIISWIREMEKKL